MRTSVEDGKASVTSVEDGKASVTRVRWERKVSKTLGKYIRTYIGYQKNTVRSTGSDFRCG